MPNPVGRRAGFARRPFLAGAAAAAAAPVVPRIARAAGRALAVGYVPSTLFAPLFVAAARGYLEQAGFTPNLTPIVSGQDAMALAATGQLDVVAAALSASFYNAVDRGLDVKFVASTAYQPRVGHPSALMVREDLWAGGLRTVAALRGRKIAWLGGPGAAGAYYVARILRPAGLTLRDVEPVNLSNPDQGVALARRAVDAVFSNAPFTDAFAQQKLARIVGYPPAGISASGIFFGPNLLNAQAQGHAVMDALRHGARDLQGNGYDAPDVLAALVSYTKTPLETIKAAPRYDVYPDLRVDGGTVADMQREFAAEGVLAFKTPLDPGRLVARF